MEHRTSELIMNLLKYFPYEKARPHQRAILEAQSSQWNGFDVDIVTLPTGGGKTALMETYLSATGSACGLVPTNQLVLQHGESFPQRSLRLASQFHQCETHEKSCAWVKKTLGHCCQAGCSLALQQKDKQDAAVMNYWMHAISRQSKPVVVIDEAHKILDKIRSDNEVVVWAHDSGMPDWVTDMDTAARWLSTISRQQANTRWCRRLLAAVNSPSPMFVVKQEQRKWGGAGTKKGEFEMRPCLVYYPIDVSTARPVHWPVRSTKKIILMSATIAEPDIRDLGLHRRRVRWLTPETSPIDAARRPTILVPVTKVSHSRIKEATAEIAQFIRDDLLPIHKGESGIIHATYGQAPLLAEALRGVPNVLIHDKDDKQEIYEKFRNAKKGTILIASGMYEGVDLPHDKARWSVVAKVPWPSLEQPAIAWRAKKDPSWYRWQTLRTLVQASGRVCRTPTDWGVTYIVDDTAERLIDASDDILPEWWKECLWKAETYEDIDGIIQQMRNQG